jgi:hypothetical protein
MLRKDIKHLKTEFFYLCNQRRMDSEGQYNEAISNIGQNLGWIAPMYNFFFFGMKTAVSNYYDE